MLAAPLLFFRILGTGISAFPWVEIRVAAGVGLARQVAVSPWDPPLGGIWLHTARPVRGGGAAVAVWPMYDAMGEKHVVAVVAVVVVPVVVIGSSSIRNAHVGRSLVSVLWTCPPLGFHVGGLPP